MKKSIFETVSVVACICILASCASVHVESWTDPSFEGKQIHKVAVLGVAKSENIRRRFEDAFAEGLAQSGLQAVASYTFLPKVPQGKKLSREEVAAALNKRGLDSIIVTRALGERQEVRYDSTDVDPPYYRGYYRFYDLSHDYVNSPGYVDTYIETQLESNLYDVKSGKLVWTGKSQITDQSSDEHNIKSVVVAVIKDLQKKGIIYTPPKK